MNSESTRYESFVYYFSSLFWTIGFTEYLFIHEYFADVIIKTSIVFDSMFIHRRNQTLAQNQQLDLVRGDKYLTSLAFNESCLFY